MKQNPPKTLLSYIAFKRFVFVMSYFSLFALFSVNTLAENYQVTTIDVEPLTGSIQRTGTLAFKRTLNLSFKTNGYLKKLKIDEGDLFLNNQLLAALDLVELKAEKNAAYALLRQAKNDVQRISTLLAKNLSSEQTLELMKTKVHTSRAAYKIAYYNLEKAEIRSPFTGVVLKRFGELGELQLPGNTILQVAALDKNIVVRVALTGKEAAQVTVGKQVRVVLQSGEVFSAAISKIAVVADPQSHLFMIEVLLPTIEFNNGAIAGQLAEVIIKITKNNLVYRIPIEALVAVNQQGKALLMIQTSETNKKITQYAFDILKLDNRYLYIPANNDSNSLLVITRGWQQLAVINKATAP